MVPEVRYATSGELQIAYQVVGNGPIDVIFAFDWAGNIELAWENPQTERFLRRFTSYGRLIFFDMRGVGLSDPAEDLPPREEWMDDIRAVMDAAGSDRAALVGHGHAGQLCMLVAASHPERVRALVTVNSFARLSRAPGYRAGMPESAQQTWLQGLQATRGTTDPLHLMVLAPDLIGDEFARSWWARLERAAGSPRRAARKQELAFQLDVRDVLPAIGVPTLVVQSAGKCSSCRVRAAPSRSTSTAPDTWNCPAAGTGRGPPRTQTASWTRSRSSSPGRARPRPPTGCSRPWPSPTSSTPRRPRRRWATTDGVRCSRCTTRSRHARSKAARGRLIKSTGDGHLMTFDGPARAIRCVEAVEKRLASLGVHLRAGLHTGEIELLGDDIGGIAVSIAARLTSLAGADEVVVSSTVKDLVVGSGIGFEDRGTHALKGVPDQWHAFRVSSA